MTSHTGTNGSLNDRMAKMRAAKAAKLAVKRNIEKSGRQGLTPEVAAQLAYQDALKAKPPPEKVKIGEMLKITLPKQYEQPPVMRGVLDVQIGTDPDMQNVTLVVKGPAPKMRALVRFAIEQSVPFLNEDAS